MRAGLKYRLLADLAGGQLAMLAACARITPAQAIAPWSEGRWSPRDILLHLAFWDEWTIGELPSAIARDERPAPFSREQNDAANAAAVRAGAALGWDAALALYEDARARLIAQVDAVPARPASRWAPSTALGGLLHAYGDHDRHHAAQVRQAARGPAFAPAFAVQRASASPRETLRFELERARASLKAAVQGISPSTAERPTAPGKWSIREIVLHLSERDRVRLEEFARTLSGQPHSWRGMEDPEMGPVNEAHLAPLRGHTWDEALRRLDSMREELLRRLADVPAEPDDVWRRGHAFADMMWGLPGHDRHHAEQIQRARLEAPARTTA